MHDIDHALSYYSDKLGLISAACSCFDLAFRTDMKYETVNYPLGIYNQKTKTPLFNFICYLIKIGIS